MSSRSLRYPSFDALGAAASLACAVHCALMPLVLGLLPLSGFVLQLADPRMEWLLVSLSLSLASISLVVGFKQHRSHRILLLFVAASSALLVARLGEELGWSLPAREMAIGAALLLVASHLLNASLSRRAAASSGGQVARVPAGS